MSPKASAGSSPFMKSRLSEVRRARPLLGTFVEIALDGMSGPASHRAIDSAFRVIEEVQARMNFHDPGSTLSFLNRNAGHRAVPVDEWTFEVLECAAELHAVSGGIFDVTIAPQLQALELLPDRHVRFRQPNVKIDLGGIAKGFAVDQAIAALKSRGASRGLVNAGGDLRAFGEPGFPVHVRHPRAPGAALLSFCLTNAAVATSAHYFADRIVIMDGRDKNRASKIISATVRAGRAMVADALTKVVMISGEEAQPVLKYFQADAIFVAQSGEALCSPDWHATLDLPA